MNGPVRILLAVAVSAASVACCRVPDISAQLAGGGRLIWSASLSLTGEAFPTAEYEAVRHIAFASDDELVAIDDAGPWVSRTNMTVIKAADGSVVRRLPLDYKSSASVFPTASGQYVIVANGITTLYSSGLRSVVRRMNDAVSYISPDRRVLARTQSIGSQHATVLFDAETLKPLPAGFVGPYLWSFTDRWIADVLSARNGDAVVRLTDSQGHQIDWESTCKSLSRPIFVSSDLVAAMGCNRVNVITTAGTTVFSPEVPGGDAYVAASSAKGNRFAVVQTFRRPGDPARLCAERVTVVDINQQQAVFATDVLDLEGMTLGASSGVAFSPSGASLAVKSGDTVRMFALPPAS